MTWKKEVAGIRYLRRLVSVQSRNLLRVVYLTRAYTYSIPLGVAPSYKGTGWWQWHHITHAVIPLYAQVIGLVWFTLVLWVGWQQTINVAFAVGPGTCIFHYEFVLWAHVIPSDIGSSQLLWLAWQRVCVDSQTLYIRQRNNCTFIIFRNHKSPYFLLLIFYNDKPAVKI